MKKDMKILIMKIANLSEEVTSPCDPLSKASSSLQERSEPAQKRPSHTHKHGFAHFKCPALLRLKIQKAFQPLTGLQMATLQKLFEGLGSVEVRLQTDIAASRPGDFQSGVCIASVAISSIMERRMKLRASLD